MDNVSYRYQPNIKVYLLATLFFGICMSFFVYQATTNDRGAIVNGIIELPKQGATNLYWGFAAASFIFVAVGLALLIKRLFGSPQYLFFEQESMLIPAGAFSRDSGVRIMYTEVSQVEEFEVSGTKIITVFTSSGKKVNINNRMLKSNKEYEQVVETLRQKISVV